MTQSVILNLKAPTTLETGIAFTQGDYGEEAVLQILTKDDDTYITDALSASISFTRSDGYIVTGELTGGGGIYQYQFKGNELQSAGKAVAVVTLEFAGGRVSTGSFAFNVRYNPMFDRGIDAGPYIWELEKIVASAKSYIEYLEALIEQLKPGIGSTALTKADLVNGFDQVEAGIKALDAAAGKRLWDKFGDYILKKQIVNNLLATQPGNPLDATQGKILADKFAQLNSDIIAAYNEIDAVYGTDEIVCSLALKPGHQYLILCSLTTSESDSSSIMSASLNCVGDARVIGGITVRTTMHSGGGCTNWMFVEPTADVTINLYSYGYSSKTYKYKGTLMAIQLR